MTSGFLVGAGKEMNRVFDQREGRFWGWEQGREESGVLLAMLIPFGMYISHPDDSI